MTPAQTVRWVWTWTWMTAFLAVIELTAVARFLAQGEIAAFLATMTLPWLWCMATDHFARKLEDLKT